MAKVDYDVIIVGAGVAGLSLAYHLSSGLRVLVLEQEGVPGYHASGRNAACFAPNYGPPLIRKLTQASEAFFVEPPAGFSEGPLLSDRGILTFATEDRVADLEQAMAVAQDLGNPMVEIAREEAQQRLPVLQTEDLAMVAYDASLRDIDVAAYFQGYVRAVQERAVCLQVNMAALSLQYQGGLWRVEAGGGAFTAARVVNAAGAWADDLAVKAGLLPCGLSAYRRSAFVFREERWGQAGAWPMFKNVQESFYCKATAEGFFASPADEEPMLPCDAVEDEAELGRAVAELARHTDLRVEEMVRQWGGLRSFSEDRLPIVGEDAGQPGFFWFAGLGGYGMKVAPALAEMVASLVKGEGFPERMAAWGIEQEMLSPRRFG